MFRIVKMFSDLHYFIVAEYIYTGNYFRNQFIYGDRFLEFHFLIKKRVVGRGIAHILLINEVTICIKKRVFCTERHSLRYEGLVVKFVQFYKDPGEMHTCRNKSIRL